MDKQPNHAMNIHLELRKSSTLPNYIQKASVEAMIHHLLFVRKIVPLPPMEILDMYEREMASERDDTTRCMRQIRRNEHGAMIQSGGSYHGYHGYHVYHGSSGRHQERGSSHNSNANEKNSSFHIHVDDDVPSNHNGPMTSQSSNLQHLRSSNHNSNKRQRISDRRNAAANARKEAKIHRKFMKCGSQLQQLIQDLNHLFGNDCENESKNENENEKVHHRMKESGVKAVLITIGPSFNSPREQYLIQFHSWPSFQTNNSVIPTSTNNTAHHTMNVKNLSSIPSQQRIVNKKKLENEISKRIVSEFIKGIYNTAVYDDDENHGKEGDGSEEKEAKLNHYQKFEEYSQRSRNGGGNSISTSSSSSSNLKMNIACLITKSKSEELFQSVDHHTKQSSLPLISSLSTSSPASTSSPSTLYDHHHHQQALKYSIERDFVIKVPRMVSKRREIHRPFVIMNIKPMLQPSMCNNNNNNCGDNDEIATMSTPSFHVDKNDDIWVRLNSTVKGC